ncbi:hypothetical protein RDI58_029468 [Solanum bulbocastanum]|uniref:Uncharacterized protein n=1 Tax=Solanum bulbocastanum TaxID=147425 RepID=A0AAN8SUI0_SOLBU
MEIKILCTKLMKPFLPTPPHLQRYKLSFFDQISEKEHVTMVFFFHNYNNIDMDEQLEQSLSKILTHVYLAAGRYDDKDEYCSILCLDQGVFYTKAMTNDMLDNYLNKARNDFGHAALFSPHVNKNIDETNFMVSPILTIQVTKLNVVDSLYQSIFHILQWKVSHIFNLLLSGQKCVEWGLSSTRLIFSASIWVIFFQQEI